MQYTLFKHLYFKAFNWVICNLGYGVFLKFELRWNFSLKLSRGNSAQEIYIGMHLNFKEITLFSLNVRSKIVINSGSSLNIGPFRLSCVIVNLLMIAFCINWTTEAVQLRDPSC